MQERIIVTMTTYSKRIGNIPTVLDTIFKQTIHPDIVVINLAYEEIIPDKVQRYIETHNIEIIRVPDTKVYKKIVPTLKKYPDDCVINIDDDKLYPPEMIADFMDIHKKYPNNPISGNRQVYGGRQCHHGYASLVKSEYFGEYLDLIMDEDVIKNCPSSDLVYTYFANKAGNPYIRTTNLYYSNLTRFNEGDSYSENQLKENGDIYTQTFKYLINRFGPLKGMIESYVKDSYIAQIIYDLNIESQSEEVKNYYKQKYTKMLETSPSYKLGSFLLFPLKRLKSMKKNKCIPRNKKRHMELIRFRRQYLITTKEVTELDGWQKETFNGMNVYAEQSLEIHKINEDNKEFLLLGYWINPHSPEKNNSDIMEDMVEECDTFESVLQFLYPLSGRYALFCKFGGKAYGVSDAGGFRPIYYTDNNKELNITSNIFLLKYVMDLKEKKEKYQFEHSNFYKWSPTFGWCPGYTFYQNVESVIANHYLDINERKICRFFPNKVLRTIDSETDVYNCVSRIAELLRNSIAGIVSRGAVSFSLTSGYDSRLILSTAKEFAGKMYFWISYNSKKERDYYLPQKILSDNNLPFHPIKNRSHISREQSRFYFENTPMVHEIWCRYYMSMVGSYPDDFVVIRGSASGTIKREYYSNILHPKQVTMSFLSKNSNFAFLSECQFLREYMECYIDSLQVSCDEYGYKTLDLLQWESGEGGQWQAQSQLESDFLHDVFVPLSNREIIDLFLQLPDEYRDPKDMKAYKEIIKIGWSELLNHPFNPPSKYSKFELKMQYYKEAAKFKLKKMFGK